jgi:hypothetical protein
MKNQKSEKRNPAPDNKQQSTQIAANNTNCTNTMP